MTIKKNPLRAQQDAADRRRKHVQKERRNFLEMIGKTGIATSALKASSLLGGVMAARYAAAAGEKKRVIYCYVHSGVPAGTWLPSSASSMNISSQHYGPQGQNVAELCHFRTVDTEVNGHGGARQALGAPDRGRTVDNDMASILGASTPYSRIYLGSNGQGSGLGDNFIISSSGLPQDDPGQAFKTYFQTTPPDDNDGTYLKSFQAQYAAIEPIKNKLSSEEQHRMEEHFIWLKKIEDRLTTQIENGGPDLESCSPAQPTNYNDDTHPAMVEHGKIQGDILVAALKCNLTNVGVLQIGAHNGGGWTFFSNGVNYNGHDAAHSAPAGTFQRMMTAAMEIPAYIIKRLSEETDSDGAPLIQSTAFVQVTCMGSGLSHNSTGAPFLLATQMPGFSGGFSRKNTSSTGRHFHAAVAQGMGIPLSELSLKGATAGDMDFS